MEKANGIGGFFFRARVPAALGQWYNDHLGVTVVPSNYDELPWQQEAGPTAFAAFPEATEYFGDASKTWMINFRVRNLGAMVRNCARPAFTLKLTSNITGTAGSPV